MKPFPFIYAQYAFFISVAVLLLSCDGNQSEASLTDANGEYISSGGVMSILKAEKPFVKLLSGTINDIPIAMQLIFATDSTVKGSYYYTKYNELLPFTGNVSRDGRIALSVYDITTETTELFKGRITNDWKITGKWFKAEAGADKLDFQLQANDSPSPTNTFSAGTYEADTFGQHQTLAIRNLTSEGFEFQMEVGSELCSGVIEIGKAYFCNANNANYYGEENCYMSFQVVNHQIKVTETNCLYYHGMRCTFDGNYQKSSDEVKWIDDFYADDATTDAL